MKRNQLSSTIIRIIDSYEGLLPLRVEFGLTWMCMHADKHNRTFSSDQTISGSIL
jgi:hypothetical protein